MTKVDTFVLFLYTFFDYNRNKFKGGDTYGAVFTDK